jgi:protein ImuA
MSRAAGFNAVRARIAAMQAGAAQGRASVLPFGDERIDRAFAAGGLPLVCWHEVAGEGLEIETAAAAAAFAAALAGPLAGRGPVVWVMRREDLYVPGLAGLGFPADQLIQVSARDEAQALAALEDCLGTAGVAAAIGEIAEVDLTAGRRLQLACERGGATGFVIRRRPFGTASRAPANAPSGAGSAAATRWSIAPAPSGAALAASEGEPALGPPRWRASLTRCRGGRPGAWILETNDGAHPLRVVAELVDRQLETPQPRRLAG